MREIIIRNLSVLQSFKNKLLKLKKNDQNLMNDWNFNMNSTKLRDHNIENMANRVIIGLSDWLTSSR